MLFWERCFLRTFHCLAADCYAGRDEMAWWLTEASQHGLLPLAQLSTAALATMATIVPAGRSLRREVDQELARRRLTPSELGAELIRFQRPDLERLPVFAAMDRVDQERYMYGLAVVTALYVAPLSDFFSRFYLVETAVALTVATKVVHDTYWSWDYGAGLPFLSAVLQHVFDAMPQWNPTSFPQEVPAWFAAISQEEQDFLRSSFKLSRPHRVVLFSTVYGGATSIHLAGAIGSRTRAVAAHDVDERLKDTWTSLFYLL